LVALLACGIAFAQTPKKVLFDHTGHEDGGVSAYWIIDTHEPDPSPANPTAETDWNGGISAWAFDLYNKGYQVQTLPASGGRITYNDATNPQDLKNYAAFIIPERYTYFTPAEKQAIVAYVQAGGGLYLMGNHLGATRVTSSVPGSTDAFTVFNDLLANEGSGFGFTFVAGHGPGDASANTTTTAITSGTGAIETALVHGANGVMTAMDFHSYSYLNLTGSNPTATWIVQTQVSGDPATDYFVVASTVGSGRVVAIGDSAPSDDGTTTTSGKNLIDGYHSNSNQAFHLNATDWLTGGTVVNPGNTVTASISTPSADVTVASGASQSFAGSATDSSSSATLSYGWNFGDGSTATGAAASHVFTNTGASAASYTVTLTATDNTGATGTATRTVTVNPASTGGSQQLIQNPGFEGGAAIWSESSGVIAQNNGAGEPAHTGIWDAWLDGYGTAHTDTLSQTVTIPGTATTAALSFWLHIDTAETATSANDTLAVQVLDASGAVLQTLATYSNLDANNGYSQVNFDLSAYKGQTITIYLQGVEDNANQTSFVVDDFALNVQ
jgi:hypothetical protein